MHLDADYAVGPGMEDVVVHLRDALALIGGRHGAGVDLAVLQHAFDTETSERDLERCRAVLAGFAFGARGLAREILARELEIVCEPREETLGEGVHADAAFLGVEEELGHARSILARAMRTLYGITMSPWTEKARWALDHHGLSYSFHEHVPIVGELFLRVKASQARGRKAGEKASVPLLVDGDVVLPSSLSIARHSDEVGTAGRDPLFPKGEEAEVERWAALSDRMISAGRSKVLGGLRTNRTAQIEALPPFMPGFMKGAFAPMTSMAANFLASKHGVPEDAEAEANASLRPALEEVRKAKGDREYLLGKLTFADFAIASALRAVRPEPTAPFGPGTREIWSNEALAAEFGDLLAWRDALYAKHRKAPESQE